MSLLEHLAETNIQAAIDRGELDDLPGHGEPLVLDDDSAVPEELRAGFRMLKNAGYLPAELGLRREIQRVETLILKAESQGEKARLLLKVSLLKSQLG